MKVLIDDTKAGVDFDVVIRSGQAAIQFFYEYEFLEVSLLGIDFDLGDELFNGLHVLQHLENSDVLPASIVIASNNPVGRQKIAAYLREIGFTERVGRFVR